MVTIEGLTDELGGILNTNKGLLSNPTATAIGGAIAGAAITGAVIATATAIKSSTSSSSSKKRKTTKKGRSRDRKYISNQKHERAYQKRRKKLGKKTYGKRYKKKSGSSKFKSGIKYTKNGQPYRILKNGRARFIKKK